ncbi:MAG: hypothetical protein K6G00_08055, partial [Treponema sp.]|nr:hypothetical protein [Treponema sp.]
MKSFLLKNIRRSIGLFAIIFLTAMQVYSQKVTIDYRYNTIIDDGSNYLTWSIGRKNFKDGLDVSTGASLQGSANELDDIIFDSEKRQTAPLGLKDILLLAVSSPDVRQLYGVTFEVNERQITVRCCRNGIATLMSTDVNGRIDLEHSFKSAVIGIREDDNSITYMDDVLKPGSNNKSLDSVDWSKVYYTDDKASLDADEFYSGILKTSYKKGILKIKGTLKK